jgi:hypothetical protein
MLEVRTRKAEGYQGFASAGDFYFNTGIEYIWRLTLMAPGFAFLCFAL